MLFQWERWRRWGEGSPVTCWSAGTWKDVGLFHKCPEARCSRSPSLCMPHGHQPCSGPSLVLGPPQGRHPRCKGCGKGFWGKSRAKDGFVSPFSHANFKRVFLPASPRLALMYFRDNFSILQTPHWHRAGFVARGNAKQGDKLTPTGHCRKKLASGSCSCQTFPTSGHSNQLQWCSKPRRRRRRRACGAQSMLQSKGRGSASWLLQLHRRAKSTK